MSLTFVSPSYSGDVKYFLLTSDEFGEGWNAYFHFINLPRQVVGAREVRMTAPKSKNITRIANDVNR